MSIKVALAGCLALAGLSLLLPGAPSYDPLSWVVWGREVVELDLKTSGGPSWKPLPVAFTTVFALVGGAAPWLWLVLARASALLGLVFAYRIASRLAGAAAGVIAVAALVFSRGWFWSDWIGYSEGLLLALVLWAVDRHLAGRHRQTLVLGFLAALLRPEVWPFAAAYGIWLCLREPTARRLSAGLALGVPALWLLPELIGSGDAFRASERARAHGRIEGPRPVSSPRARGALRRSHGAAVARARRLRSGARELAAAAGSRAAALALGLGALGWLGLVAAMARAGYSGNPRYLIAPAGIACVVAGVGWASAGRALLARARLPSVLVGAATVFLVPRCPCRGCSTGWTACVPRARACHRGRPRRQLPGAIRLAGGRRRLLACGTPVTQLFPPARCLGDARPPGRRAR